MSRLFSLTPLTDKSDITSWALAFGYFDGIHLGHRALIGVCRENATRLCAGCAILTFTDEEGLIKRPTRLLSEEEEKTRLRSLGVDGIFRFSFSHLRRLSPEEFFRAVLSEIPLSFAVCGFNYRFGAGASGGADDLRDLCENEKCSHLSIGRFFGIFEKFL